MISTIINDKQPMLLLPKHTVGGKLTSRNILLLLIFDHATAILLLPAFFAFECTGQLVIHSFALTACMMLYKRSQKIFPSTHEPFHLSFMEELNSSYLAIFYFNFMIQCNIKSNLIFSLLIILHCKKMQVEENMVALTLLLNITGHGVCSMILPTTRVPLHETCPLLWLTYCLSYLAPICPCWQHHTFPCRCG